MVECRLDCEDCRHLTVVSLHDTSPWTPQRKSRVCAQVMVVKECRSSLSGCFCLVCQHLSASDVYLPRVGTKPESFRRFSSFCADHKVSWLVHVLLVFFVHACGL